MISEKMSYKDYIWEYNPSSIVITEEKDTKEFLLPDAGNIFQNYGRKKRIVSGSGDFFGEDCLNQFNELRKVYLDSSYGYLKIPNISPFLAVFNSLRLKEDAAENIISYSFEFWEKVDYNVSSISSGQKKYHIAAMGETLFTIAVKYGVTVTELLKLNSDIKRPDEISEGQKVIIP